MKAKTTVCPWRSGLVAVWMVACLAETASAASVRADFDGDGFSDLAIGIPGENLNGHDAAGAVNVLYGSPAGLASAGSQLWTQGSAGVAGTVDYQDLFGSALAAGDFNGDGRADLAIGAPGDGVNGLDGAGAVNVLYGSASGLTANGSQIWSQATAGVPGALEGWEEFGSSLTSGDFDGDGKADLAIGVPQESINGLYHAGAVNVLYGSSSGLTAAGSQLWSQESAGVPGTVETMDEFGLHLAARDFDDDGRADLAIGVSAESVDGVDNAGAVNVLYGSGAGLTASGSQIFSQHTPGVPGVAEDNERFGSDLAAGDFDGDGHMDLAVGVFQESVNGVNGAGAVNVLYGAPSGLTATGSQIWHLDSPGVPGVPDMFDNLGLGLETGDFNDDGRADLAMGAPGATVNVSSDEGLVVILYGCDSGLTSTGSQLWSQDSPGVPGTAQGSDSFGRWLGGGDFNGDGTTDLVISVYGDTVSGIVGAGAVNVLHGSPSGLTSVGSQLWSRDSPGVPGVAQAHDAFGVGLTRR